MSLTLERLLPLPAQQPGDGQAQLAGARPGATVALAQTREETGAMGRLPGRATEGAVWPLVLAGIRRVEAPVRGTPNALR